MIIAFVKGVPSVSFSSMICGNELCGVHEFNKFLTYNVLYNVSEINGDYNTIIYQEDIVPKNQYIISISEISCTNSYGFIFDNDGNQLYNKSLSTNNANSCSLNWDNMVSSYTLSSKVNIIVAFKGISEVNTMLEIIDGGNIVPYYEDKSLFNVINFFAQSKLPASSNITVETTLRRNHFTASDCLLPETVTFLFGGNCKKVANLKNDDGTFYDYAVDIEPESFGECSFNSFDNDGVIVYEMNTNVTFDRPTCSYATIDNLGKDLPLVNWNSVLNFNVTMDSVINVDNGMGDIVDNIVPTITDYTLSKCDNRFSPMGNVQLTLQVQTQRINATSRSFISKTMDSIPLSIVSGPSCETDVNETETCEWVLITDECIFVDINDETQCSFSYIGQMNIDLRYDYEDGSFIENGVVNKLLEKKTFNTETCPVTYVQNDVTSEYIADLSVQGNALDQDMELSVTLTELDENNNVAVTIEEIEVEMNDGYMKRIYNVDNKIQRMPNELHPYYSDAHFCRYRSCSNEFYDNTTNRWNDWCEDNSNTLFSYDNTYHFDQCQLMSKRNNDVFIFNPSKWVFGQYDGIQATFKFNVKAVIESCENRRMLNERSLQSQKVETVLNFISKTRTVVVVANGGMNGNNNNNNETIISIDSNSKLNTVGIVGITIISSLATFIVILYIYHVVNRKFLRTRKNSDIDIINEGDVENLIQNHGNFRRKYVKNKDIPTITPVEEDILVVDKYHVGDINGFKRTFSN